MQVYKENSFLQEDQISKLLVEAYINANAVANSIKKDVYKKVRIKRKILEKNIKRKKIEELKKYVHPIFLQDIPHFAFMDEKHFLRYWYVKKQLLKWGKFSPKVNPRLYPSYKELEGYIVQQIIRVNRTRGDDVAYVIIGRDDTTNRLFVEILPDTMTINTVDDLRELMGYGMEYDEYLKGLKNPEFYQYEPVIDFPDVARNLELRGIVVRVQGDLKMRVERTHEITAMAFVLHTFFDELVWYLYRKKQAMDLLEKYVLSFMPPEFNDLIPGHSASTAIRNQNMMVKELIEKYPDVVRKFIAKHTGNWILSLGRPPNGHIVKIKNAIRLNQRQFIVTKMTKIHISHPEHGELDVPVPVIARVTFFI